MEIVKLGVHGLIWKPAQKRDDSFEFRVAPSIALIQIERRIVISGFRCRKLDPLVWIDTKIAQPRSRVVESIARQHLRGAESDAVRQNFLPQFGRRDEVNRPQPWLVHCIPVYQGCFQVAIEKIESAEEFTRISILRIEA